MAVTSALPPSVPADHSTCSPLQRFRDLALDRRSWLYVTHTAAQAGQDAPRRRRSLHATPSSACLGSPTAASAALTRAGEAEPEDDAGCHWYRSQFSLLADALAASRPGDTILLEAGPGGKMNMPGRVASQACLVPALPVQRPSGSPCAVARASFAVVVLL